jgi:hypothetical protein
LALAGCGGGSGDASSLLKQTFSGSHAVTSGNLTFTLTVNPSGSAVLKGPITLSFGGPFQSLGTGKLPKSDFNISLSGFGKTGSLGIISTGTTGYVTLSGVSYQLPAATFQKLESSFGSIASSGGATAGSSALTKLGINPLHWLVNPSVIGDESVAGASTTHIRAGINVASLLDDLNTFLSKASSLGVGGTSTIPTSISAATRQKIAGEVQNPTFDVWTGSSDKTVRKLAINLTVPVTGAISTQLGGLRSAGFGLTLQYGNLNQPQTITAPTTVRPYTEFQVKIRSFLQTVQSTLASAAGGAATGTSTTTTSSGSTTNGSSTPSAVQAYGQCIQAAGGDVSKMQQCAPLLNGK